MIHTHIDLLTFLIFSFVFIRTTSSKVEEEGGRLKDAEGVFGSLLLHIDYK